MTTAVSAPAAMPTPTAAKKSMLWSPMRPPAAADPIPTSPYWPRLIWPAHPVRMTSDTAMIPTIGRIWRPGRLGSLRTYGRITATAIGAIRRMARARCTWGSDRSSIGTGRKTAIVCQLDASASTARLRDRRCTSRATRITGSMRAWARSLVPVAVTEVMMSRPMPRPMSSAMPRFSIRATTAAASP